MVLMRVDLPNPVCPVPLIRTIPMLPFLKRILTDADDIELEAAL